MKTKKDPTRKKLLRLYPESFSRFIHVSCLKVCPGFPRKEGKKGTPSLMGETQQIVNLSDLISRARPLTGTSSFTYNFQFSSSNSQPSTPPPNPSPSNSQTTNSKVLEPLNFPALLIGTLTLPSHSSSKGNSKNPDSNIECCCFQFADSSATICCDILHFCPEIIGRKIRVLAWNFLPLSFRSSSSGFLEIIRWEFAGWFQVPVSFPLVLAAVNCSDDPKCKYSIFGLLESVSPTSVVPCSAGTDISENICGFLAKILVCVCKSCKTKDLNRGIADFTEENYKNHAFRKCLVVYFVGAASSWLPVFSKLVRCMISLSGLKKKMVYIGKEESQMMLVTTNKTSLHLPKLRKKWSSNEKDQIRWLGEVGCYAGTVTGIYMEGIVVELDGNVMLLLTEHQLMVPHSLRVGTIIFVRNVHFLQPKFSWTKLLVLGACFITSISVESFSPLETKCHTKSNPHKVLRNVLGSLAFSARLWVLLVVSCLQIKFTGILSEKEILGSKNKDGLALAYITSQLPSSAYRKRHGVFVEYCKHGMCLCGNEEDYSFLKLVVPVSYLVNHCKSIWTKLLMKHENDYNVMSTSNQDSFILCRGRSYVKSIRRSLCCKDIGVIMLGKIKVCSSSGRLQLADATGSVDVVVSNSPLTWNSDTIYEVEKFSVIMHGPPHKLDQSSSAFSEFFTCRSIFGHAPLSREGNLSLYVHYNFDDQKSRLMCSPCVNSKGTFQEPEGGTYHLLWLRHKFPLLIEADRDTSNRSSVFAECIMLPWELNITKKNEMETMTGLTSEEVQNTTQYPTQEKIEEDVILRKCKTSVALSKAPDSWSCDASSVTHGSQAKCGHLDSSEMLKISCLICSRCSKCSFQGLLHCADTKALTNSGWGPDGQKLLLEFDSNALYLYQGLRIGSFYIVKHDEKRVLCNTKVDRSKTAGSMYILRETGMWSVSFLSRDGLNTSDSSSILPLSNSFVSMHEVNFDDVQQFKLSLTSSDVSPEICSDITLFVPVSFISYLKSSLTKPFVSVEEESSKCNIAPESSSGISFSNLLLPEGNLVSLDGLVLAVHDFNHDSVNGHWENEASCNTHQPEILQETSHICIHIFVGNQMAKIFGPKRKQVYPTGFSQGVHATIHRVLVISGQYEYMLTPASFIVVNAYVANYRNTAVSCSAHANSPGPLGQSLDNFPASALISEITVSKDAKPIQLRVRTVGLYILVLRSKRKADYSNTREQTGTSIFDIPLAGFFIDDGSSSCCCWANEEEAATLLKLSLESNGPEAHAAGTRERSRSSDMRKEDYGSKVGRLNKILCRCGGVVVKNYGSMFDSSCLDLAISVESGHTLSRSDEEFLRCLILDACFSATWQIVGSVVDSIGNWRLEEKLRELGIKMLPFRNVLASKVFHSHPLSEARQMFQDLMNN